MSRHQPSEPTVLENVSRLTARGFVIAGGTFWMIAAFFGPYAYRDMSIADSLSTAAGPFLATVVILLVGWTYESLASVLLFAAAAAVLVWGVLYSWEAGVWLLVTGVLISPMVIAGVLFAVAAWSESRNEEGPEPVPVGARSRYSDGTLTGAVSPGDTGSLM